MFSRSLPLLRNLKLTTSSYFNWIVRINDAFSVNIHANCSKVSGEREFVYVCVCVWKTVRGILAYALLSYVNHTSDGRFLCIGKTIAKSFKAEKIYMERTLTERESVCVYGETTCFQVLEFNIDGCWKYRTTIYDYTIYICVCAFFFVLCV